MKKISELEKVYNQSDIDKMLFLIVNGETLFPEMAEDCARIQKVIMKYRTIQLSVPASGYFWLARSNWYDASWLTLPKNDEQIVEDWDAFIEDWHRDE